MPGFDGTGPQGQGPMTGGARGYCALPAGRNWPRPFGRRAFGRGKGRGFRNWYYATGLPGWARTGYEPYAQEPTVKEEADILRQEAQVLKQELEAIQNRLELLAKAKGTE